MYGQFYILYFKIWTLFLYYLIIFHANIVVFYKTIFNCLENLFDFNLIEYILSAYQSVFV